MAFATAALDARAGRRAAAAAFAAALQGVFYWLILQEAVAPTVRQSSTPLEITVLQTARRYRPAALPPQPRPEMSQRLAVPREVPLPAKITATMTLPRATERVPQGPVNWHEEIQGEVRAESRSPPHKLQFGFPQAPPPGPAPPPAFGWDYAHTHRLVALPEGGMLINLTDRCALVVYGLLIPFCRIGKMSANGGLFDHLHDRPSAPPIGGLP